MNCYLQPPPPPPLHKTKKKKKKKKKTKPATPVVVSTHPPPLTHSSRRLRRRRRGDVIPNDHALYLGMAGYGAPSVVRERLEAADLIVVLGARLNEITTSAYAIPAPGQRWIHVDVDPSPRPWFGAPELVVKADAKAFVRAALGRLKDAVLLAEPLQARLRHNETDKAAWERATKVDGGEWSGPGVHPGRVVAALRRLLPDDAIITTDAGNFGGWAARGFRFRRPGTFLGPTSGAMGYGLPAAIAASIVHRDRPVVALVGDGGLAMTLADIETAVREHAKVIVLVFDNERYGTIRMHQDGAAAAARPRRTSGRSTSRRSPVRAVPAGSGWRPTTRSSRRFARRSPPIGRRVLQLVLDRRWVHVDQPAVPAATDVARSDVPSRPGRHVGWARRRCPVRGGIARRRGVRALHRWRGGDARDREPPLPLRPADVPAPDARPRPRSAARGGSTIRAGSTRTSTAPSIPRRWTA